MNLATPHVMGLPKRGQSDYMHASDVCLELIRLTGATAEIRFAVTSRLDCAIEVHADDGRSSQHHEAAGRFSALQNGSISRYRLVRRPDISLAERQPDDQVELIAGHSIIDSSIESPRVGGKHFTRQVIGLAVALLCEKMPGSTWWFSRLEIKQLPDITSTVGCTVANVVGKKFWNLHMMADGKPQGRLLMVSAQGAV